MLILNKDKIRKIILNKICLNILFFFVECLQSLVGCMHFYDTAVCVWGCGVDVFCGHVSRCMCWKFIVHLEGLNFSLCYDCCGFLRISCIQFISVFSSFSQWKMGPTFCSHEKT